MTFPIHWRSPSAGAAVRRPPSSATGSAANAAHERALIRLSGLLTLSVPREFGGQGGSWDTVMQVVRKLAAADSALAHLYGFPYLQLAGIRL